MTTRMRPRRPLRSWHQLDQLIVESSAAEIDRARSDADFMKRARLLLKRDQAIIGSLTE